MYGRTARFMKFTKIVSAESRIVNSMPVHTIAVSIDGGECAPREPITKHLLAAPTCHHSEGGQQGG